MESRLLGPQQNKVLKIVFWILAVIVAAMVIPKGVDKFSALEGTIGYFAGLGLPAALVYAVGVIEIAGPLVMFVPRANFYGAFPLFVVMAFASYFSGWNTTPIGIGLLCLFVALMTRPAILRKKAEITKISI